MSVDADWYKQHLAAKKLRGECVFAIPDHPSKTWRCITHGCGVVPRHEPGNPMYRCERSSFE